MKNDKLMEAYTTVLNFSRLAKITPGKLTRSMRDFILMLSISDGSVQDAENTFFEDYLGGRPTEEEITEAKEAAQERAAQKKMAEAKKADQKKDTSEDEQELEIPDILVKFLVYDEFSGNRKQSISYAKACMQLYELMGKEFLVCDGKATPVEVETYTEYTENMKKFLKENYKGYLEGAEGLKGTEEIIAPATEQAVSNPVEEDETTLEELMAQLEGLTGLTGVKKEVSSLLHLQEIKKLRKERGMKDISVSNHLVFTGNPGTGKTTVARILAKIYHKMGVLPTSAFIETDRSGLVGGYVGQTAIKTQEVIEKAKGGVLFIDEAYALTSYETGNDYGKEAVDTLLKAMEDNRDNMVVIVAGYPELMDQFVDSNPGLRSRFNKYIFFDDYTPEELLDIYKGMCEKNGYTNSEGAIEKASKYFTEAYENRGRDFANGRMVRNYFEKAATKQADRLFGAEEISDEMLVELVEEDLE